MVSGLWENPSEETNWITQDPQIPGALLQGATMLELNLVPEEDQPVAKQPNPVMLKATEWEKQPILLPKRSDEYSKALTYDHTKIDLEQVFVKIKLDFGIRLGGIPNKIQLTTASPRSIKQDLSTARKKFKTYMRYVEFDPQTAAPKAIDRHTYGQIDL